MKNKILIIDDDIDFLEATSTLLKAKGFEVIISSRGEEGFHKIKTDSPDVVLLDMMMAYKTQGADIAKAISEDVATRDIPVILITGMKQNSEMFYGKKPLPVKTIIEKPIKPEEMLKTINSCITETGHHHREMVGQISKFVEQWKNKRGNIIMILHAIQNYYGYVPRSISLELSRFLNVPLARIYEVITFYNFFKLTKPGKHTISVCMGTACYLKGAHQVLQELKNILHIEEGETTDDGLFHLQVVRCLGCCGLAPVIMIDEKVHGKVKKESIMDILSSHLKGEEKMAVKEI